MHPAVGSGAFLLGAIQEIVALRRGILFSQRSHVEPHEFYQTVSDWKRRTIENSLYGVDIIGCLGASRVPQGIVCAPQSQDGHRARREASPPVFIARVPNHVPALGSGRARCIFET